MISLLTEGWLCYHIPGINMGGALEPYWWFLGSQKAVLHTDTTDWCVLGQWRVTATISASTWSTYTWKGDDKRKSKLLTESIPWHPVCKNCRNKTPTSANKRCTLFCYTAFILTFILTAKTKIHVLCKTKFCPINSLSLFLPHSHTHTHICHHTCMNPLAASSWCSLLRASLPAMMPDWNPTSSRELGAAAGFHLG